MKRALFVLVAICFISLSLRAQGETPVLKGDVNGDGIVDVSDVVSVINIIADNEKARINARPLSFSVSETPLDNPEALAAVRRTAPTTTASLSSFNYYYVIGSVWSDPSILATKHEHDGQWKGGSWPDVNNNVVVTFCAYANGNNTTLTNGYLSFTADGQKDLLVASESDTYAHSTGNIGFNFNHVCGALWFSMNKSVGLSDYTVMVKTVTLYNIPCVGDYCFNDGEWDISSNAEDKKNFTIKSYVDGDYMTLELEKQSLSEPNDYLFLIPQKLTGGVPSNAYVEIECKIYKDGDDRVGNANTWGKAYLPLGIKISQGKINPINISVGTALLNANGNKIF